MTFIEVVVLIEQRGERLITDRINCLMTDRHAYERTSENVWQEKELTPEQMLAPEKFVAQPIIMPVKEKKASWK